MNLEPITSFNKAIDDLTLEAKNLIDVVRSYSDKIKEMEQNLENFKTHFPFKKLIKSGKIPNHLIPAEPEHEKLCVGHLHGYYKQTHWFFSWEKDEDCKDKRFRLFLIEAENEVIVFDYGESLFQNTEIKRLVVFKKAFADTNLKIKLEFANHLLQFIYDYSDFLRQSRSIFEEKISF